MDKTNLGDRMKQYEDCYRYYLPRRMPMIIRLDGKAFYTLTKKFDKPYDEQFSYVMQMVSFNLLEEIAGSVFVYTQSDEISILIIDYQKLETQPWYDKNLQKIISVSSSIATAQFNHYYTSNVNINKKIKPFGYFDSRAFIISKEEVCNYFIWRQNDATRNSIQGKGQEHFSHKQLQNKSCNEIQDMLMLEKGINWNDIETKYKRGLCCYKNDIGVFVIDKEIPIFSQDREFINKFVYVGEE
jgi:tRNA(His) 5'-end guanylyltransferase